MVLLVSSGRLHLIPLSTQGSWSVGGSPWQPPLVGMDVTPSAIPKTLGISPPEEAPTCGAPWVQLQQQGSPDSPLGGHPQKTSSVKDRYHFTSSLSSNMLFANNHSSSPAGRLFCSAQCWRALAYATTFSLGISLMSLQAKIESAGGMNFCLWRHGRSVGA